MTQQFFVFVSGDLDLWSLTLTFKLVRAIEEPHTSCLWIWHNCGKNLLTQQYFLHMSSQYDELRPTDGWDRLMSLGHPSKFQRVSRLGFVTAPSLNGGQPNFARCLAVSWASTLYMDFRRLLPRDGILPGAKFTLRLSLYVLLYWQRYCTALEPWASPKWQGRELAATLRGSRPGVQSA